MVINTIVLRQYLDALEIALEKLEEAYIKKDLGKVDSIKKYILDVKSKISLMLDEH